MCVAEESVTRGGRFSSHGCFLLIFLLYTCRVCLVCFALVCSVLPCAARCCLSLRCFLLTCLVWGTCYWCLIRRRGAAPYENLINSSEITLCLVSVLAVFPRSARIFTITRPFCSLLARQSSRSPCLLKFRLNSVHLISPSERLLCCFT